MNKSTTHQIPDHCIQHRFLLCIAINLINWIWCSPIHAQVLGVPFVDSYSNTNDGFISQNWDIEQGEEGRLYFANNGGLLEFDGTQWTIFPLPNRTVLRSMIATGDRIYVGGQNEFGYYEAGRKNKWIYRSLLDLIPEVHRDFEDVWDMQWVDSTLYFRSSGKIFALQANQCTVITTIPAQYMGTADGKIFVQHRAGPLFQLENELPIKVPGGNLLTGTEVRGIVRIAAGLLIATRKQGLYLFDGSTISKWANEGEHRYPDQFINTLAVLPNRDIVLGTGFRGIIVMDATGRYKYQVDTEDGLNNNRVNAAFVDRQHNLWLGLDKGVSMVRTNATFTRIYPDGELEGAGYDVAVLGDQIYFGTSSGLFYTDWRPNTFSDQFKMVPNTSGQVWGLDVIEDQLLLSHNDGAFLVDKGIAKPFYQESGTWLFREDQQSTDIVFSGNYRGISLFDRRSWQKITDIPELAESSRFIVQDRRGNYWMSHPYRGIYRVSDPLDSVKRRVQLMGTARGLPSNLQNHVFRINGEVLICAEKGIYVFDEDLQRFVHYEPLENYLGADTKVRRLFESPGGDVWFITETEIGVLKIEDSGLQRTITKSVFPELQGLMNGGWEMFYPYDEQNVFINTIDGFLHYNGGSPNDSLPFFSVLLNQVQINEDSILYLNTSMEDVELGYQQNSLLFYVSATEYINNSAVHFQYYLEGYDDGWSQPTTLRSKEYTKLSPGNYRLLVRGINQQGTTSGTTSFSFVIKDPWYTTGPALIIYSLLAGALIFWFFRRSHKRFRALEQKVDSTVKKSREEIQRLETENIQAELEHKKRELVSATLHLVQKNETISEIADQINDIKKSSGDPKITRQLQKLVHSLKQEEVVDEGWEQVMFHFNELNEGYFERLKSRFPSLTPKDLKLCAYLKMNLSTKEMATLMNVSIRGVEASRYRLRKKLNLDTDDNLTEFLMRF